MENSTTVTLHVNYTSQTDWTQIFSDRDLHIYMIINYYTISTGISLLGIVANVINSIVFHKQGFGSTINISLFGMSISDMCSQISVVWTSVVLSGLLDTLGFHMNKYEVVYLTGGHVRVCFTRITIWITVFITAERCLCITFPLKIKQTITPKRTKVILCAIFIFMVLSTHPEYLSAYLDWRFDADRNKTILGLMFTNNKERLDGLSFFLYAILGVTSFILVIIFTLTLVIKLKEKSKWRHKATNDTSRSESTSKKEQRTILMVVMIATILIICYIPSVAASAFTVVMPECSIGGQYINALFVLWSFVYIFEAFNSSVNIFIYYYLSSKYRENFRRLFNLE